MSRRLARALALLLLVAVSCGRKDKGHPTTPEVHLPPEVTAVYPDARSTGIFYETEIWAEFASPLDPTTVNERTIFLKLDTRRVPVTVSYDPARRRVSLGLRALLELRRTYTVELTSAVETVDGRSFGEGWFWQFATNSVRRPDSPVPTPGAGGEAPFTMLRWAGTEASAGDILYKLYRGSDSSAVASRSVDPILIPNNAFYVPNPRWELGGNVFWSITTLNRTTGEEIAGPVWSFSTLAVGTPIDSLTVQPSLRAYIRQGDTRISCNNGGLLTGSNYTCYIRFPFEGLPPDMKLAGLEFVLTPTQVTSLPARTPSLWQSSEYLRTCAVGFPGPPYADEGAGPIATAEIVTLNDRTRFRFKSDALTANVESAIHGYGHTGYLVRSALPTSWVPPFGSEFDFRFRLYYFRSQP